MAVKKGFTQFRGATVRQPSRGNESLRSLNATVRTFPASARERKSDAVANVLVIDDDKLFLTLMAQALRQCGHQVECALDGSAGTNVFAASAFDAVVCDMVMPQQEGFETIRHLRAARPDVAIIAISGGLTLGHGNQIDLLRLAGKLGADATLRKPFLMSALVAAVDEAISARRGPVAAARA